MKEGIWKTVAELIALILKLFIYSVENNEREQLYLSFYKLSCQRPRDICVDND